MPAHVACRPSSDLRGAHARCDVVCAEHAVRASFGAAYGDAKTACREHNLLHHA